MQGAGAYKAIDLLRYDTRLRQKRAFDKWRADEENRKFIVK